MLWGFLALDSVYTFLQHHRVALDGDLSSLVLPSPYYEPVLDSPFGWDAVTGEEVYASTNRFFVHWSMYHYYRKGPQWLGVLTEYCGRHRFKFGFSENGCASSAAVCFVLASQQERKWPGLAAGGCAVGTLISISGGLPIGNGHGGTEDLHIFLRLAVGVDAGLVDAIGEALVAAGGAGGVEAVCL